MTTVQLVSCAPYRAKLMLSRCIARWRASRCSFDWQTFHADTEKCQGCNDGERRAKGEGEGEPGMAVVTVAPFEDANLMAKVIPSLLLVAVIRRELVATPRASVGAGLGTTTATNEGEGESLPLCGCGCGVPVKRARAVFASHACRARDGRSRFVERVCERCREAFPCPVGSAHLRLYCDSCRAQKFRGN